MNIFPSMLTGLICTAGLFLLSCLIVVSAKSLIYNLKKYFPEKQAEQKPQPNPPKKMPKRKAPTIRSIEIDPTQIDRIYVKKSS